MTRANARELAVHLIYSISFTKDSPDQAIATRLDKSYYDSLSTESPVYEDRPSRVQRTYIENVVSGVLCHEEELSALIRQFSIGWDVSRISRLTLAILQLAVFEVLYVADVPTGAAISEAVRLAKLYDGDDTGSFVNGILGSFARSIPGEAK